jgi:hypothetical protein
VSADRDVNRIVRSWLEEGVTALPDRVLDTVLDQLPATPQRRAPWPVRRLLDMHIPTRFAVAAAAVLALAVIGVIAFPRSSGVAGPGPSPSPTPVPTPSPSPIPLPSTGALAPGTYSIDAGSDIPVRLTFTVPAGWATDGGFVYKDPGPGAASPPPLSVGKLLVVSWIVSHVYTDVCHWQGTLVPVGTADQFATLLANQKGRTASAPTDVLLGGSTAKRVDLTVPATLDVTKCDNGVVRFWPDPGPDESGGLCCSAVGSTDVVYTLSAAGKTYAIVARHQADTSAGDQAELDAIVASIKIGP